MKRILLIVLSLIVLTACSTEKKMPAEKIGPRKVTLENRDGKYRLYVDGNEVYAKEKADALELELQPLLGGKLVRRMSKHDTNPANNPQPPARYRN